MVTTKTNDAPPAGGYDVTKADRAIWTLSNPVKTGTSSGFTMTLNAGDVTTSIQARKACYPTHTTVDADVQAALENGYPVTILTIGESMFGTPAAVIRQGHFFNGSRGLGFLPTGKRKNGVSLANVPVLDILLEAKPESVTEIARRWYDETGVPHAGPLSRKVLQATTEKHPVALLYTHPGFGGGRVPGCVWIITHADDEIAEGYLWCPPSELTSEHGSTYLRDLTDAAMVTQPPKVTFAQCFNLPEDTREAYRAIFGK
jgi:hypothetical protein